MNAKVEQADGLNVGDVAKLVLALVLLIAGFAAFYYFENWSSLLRTSMLVVGIVAALGVAAFTHPGRAVREYLRESQFELRKVVWPTREETLRTTLVIIVVVAILSLLLGLIDLLLKWAVLDTLLKLGH